MTVTDPAHVAAAKLLREQLLQPARPAPEPHEALVRDLADYDRAFGLTDGVTDGVVESPAEGFADGEVA